MTSSQSVSAGSRPTDERIVLSVAGSSVTVEPRFGGRLSSWRAGEFELLWQAEGDELPGPSHPFGWGSFVMAPFAGRVRRGRFNFDGVSHDLPITMHPHAIHGTVYDRPWSVVGSGEAHGTSWCELEVVLRAPWPFPGVVRQRIELAPNSLRQTLEISADQPMPATMGWHPWFPRKLNETAHPVEWSFDHSGVSMMKRDDEGITTSELVSVPPGPWDDCFLGVGDVRLCWPGTMELLISHDCPVVVLFDGLDHAVCVEPQTGPPNATELWPHRCIVSPESGVQSASTVWTWRNLTGGSKISA